MSYYGWWEPPMVPLGPSCWEEIPLRISSGSVGLIVSVHLVESSLQPTISACYVFASTVGTRLPHTTNQRVGSPGSQAMSPMLAGQVSHVLPRSRVHSSLCFVLRWVSTQHSLLQARHLPSPSPGGRLGTLQEQAPDPPLSLPCLCPVTPPSLVTVSVDLAA